MDRELHRAHGQSEHRNGYCEDPSAEFFVQLCMHHWTLPRSERHAGAWAETETPNGRHLITVDGSGAGNHLVQHVFAFQA